MGESKSLKLKTFREDATTTCVTCSPSNSKRKPYDLTGVTIVFSVRRTTYEQIPLIFKTSASSPQILITDIKGGEARIFLVPEDTHDIDPGFYYLAVWLILPTGERISVIEDAQLQVEASAMHLPL
jgi:hypothetical protein